MPVKILDVRVMDQIVRVMENVMALHMCVLVMQAGWDWAVIFLTALVTLTASTEAFVMVQPTHHCARTATKAGWDLLVMIHVPTEHKHQWTVGIVDVNQAG